MCVCVCIQRKRRERREEREENILNNFIDMKLKKDVFEEIRIRVTFGGRLLNEV